LGYLVGLLFQEHLKQLKREEREGREYFKAMRDEEDSLPEGEKREFSFASTLSGMGFKERYD